MDKAQNNSIQKGRTMQLKCPGGCNSELGLKGEIGSHQLGKTGHYRHRISSGVQGTLRLDCMMERGDENKATLRYLDLIPLGEGELMKGFK